MVALLPAVAWAQAASGIAGVVRDTTGAVIPGVTVEASSPALIEQVRAVVSDGEGQYKIVDLRPGVYTVTFSLAGFNTIRREGIELSAGFTASVNADMRVGALEETITVSGAAPMVDTQNVIQQKVLTRELLDSVPTSRSNFAALTPGASRSTDVGGSSGTDAGATFSIHGSRGGDTRRVIDGMRWNSMEAGNAGTGFYFDPTGAEEIAIQLGGNSAEWELGGVQVNLIPKSGGNRFTGYAFTGYTNNSLNSTSVPDDLKARGLPTIGAVDYIYDYSGSLGGPIKQNRMWFFSAQRWWGNSSFVPGLYYNKDSSAWTYQPDLSRPAVNDNKNRHHNLRLTWQVAERHKLNLSWDMEQNCVCHGGLTASASPEGVYRWNFGPPNYIAQATWSYPKTNRLLFEAGATTLIFKYIGMPTEPLPLGQENQISVVDVTRNFRYRSNGGFYNFGTYGHKVTDQSNQRFAVSYVTGSHNFKTGVQLMEGWRRHEQAPPGSMDFNFTGNCSVAPYTPCTPLSLVQYATPNRERERLKAAFGLFAQDQWTIKRLTLNMGVRYDYLNAAAEATELPAGPFVPARSFPEVPCLPCWHDIVPRMGAAYDLFGNGNTAIKVNLGKYVAGQAVDIASALHPINASVYAVTRNWDDFTYPAGDPRNGNYRPDCDLVNPLVNGECGQISNLNFGQNNPLATQYAQDVLKGWGARGYNWQFSGSVQHQLRDGLAVNVGYFRTWFGNFNVVDNTAVTPADFTEYCVTAPRDSRLPGGGGNQVCGNYDVSLAKFGQSQTLVAQAEHYGEQSEVYDGLDVTLSARLDKLYVTGGMNTGRTQTNNCDVVMNNPQVSFGSPRTPSFCNPETPFQAQYKFAAIYELPFDIQTSATMQSYPGTTTSGSFVFSNAAILQSLGRNLASCRGAAVCNGTATINFLPSNLLFEDRYAQFDVRFTKGVTVKRAHIQGILDVFNAFNARPVLSVNTRYSGATGGSWNSPQSTLVGRLVKFSAQVNF
jgi:hypothetical protein